MNIAELDGKPFTLWLTDDNDESAVFSGTARWDGSTLHLERKPKPPFEIRPEWYERTQAVTNEEARKILLGADYFLRLYLGDVPQEATPGEYAPTGLKWPE
jgi:hypothetical protein